MKRTRKQYAAFWSATNPKNLLATHEYFNEKERFVSRYANINTGIKAEHKQTLRCLKLWLKVLGEWNGFRLTDCNTIIEVERESDDIKNQKRDNHT